MVISVLRTHFWDSAALSDVPGLSNVPSLSGAHGLAEGVA